MKRKKIFLGAVSLISIFALASCGDTTTSTGTTSSNDATSENTTSEGTSIVPPIKEEYAVVIKKTTGIDITTDVAKASKGTVVTISLVLDENYSLDNLNLDAGGIKVTLTKVNDTTYTFVMPDMDVYISATLSVEGDVTLTGDLAVALVDEGDGIYVARNVRIEKEASLAFAIKGNDHTSIVPVTSMDPMKCFADLDLNYDDDDNTEFDIAGNAVYDFFYDTNIQKTYVKRVEVISAPDSINDFESLFGGSVMSTSTEHPDGVNRVEYTNSHSHVNYQWDLYENGSLATATNTDTNYNMYVYKNYDKKSGIYTVADTYLEGLTDDQGKAYDTTRSDDTSAFAGRYQVVDTVASGYGHYQKAKADVEFDSTAFSHDIRSLDFDIHYGYRTGFSQDELKYSSRVVDSEVKTDGSFTTTVETVKDFDYSSYELHQQYSIEITFNKAGSPLSGSYLEVSTDDSNNYDFDSHEYKPGGEASNKLVKKTSFKYEYGDAKTGEIPFDITPYFVSKIKNVTIDDKVDGTEGTDVNVGTKFSDALKIEVEPSTALDAWQYGVDTSSDTAVIGPSYPSSPLDFVANSLGKSNLVINNHTTKDVSYDLSVNVVNIIKVRSFFFQGLPESGMDDNLTASSMSLYAGTSRQVLLSASPNHAPYEGVTIDTSSDLIGVNLDKKTHVLTVDASAAKVDKNTDVTLTINTPYYDTDFQNPSVLTITIMPQGEYSDIRGTYQSVTHDTDDETITYTDVAIFSDVDSLTRDGYKQLSIKIDGGELHDDVTLSFDYKYIPSTGNVYVSSNEDNSDYYFYGYVGYDSKTGDASICVYSLTTDWYDQEETDYLGYPQYDQDNNIVGYVGDVFTRAA